MTDLNDKLEIESNKVLDEGTHYSAASKEYTELVRNLTALESMRLAREKAENDQKRAEAQAEIDRQKAENERLKLEIEKKKLDEQIRLDRIKVENEHEERLARVKADIIGSRVDFGKTVFAGLVTGITTWGMLNFEQAHNITSKILAFIPKPKM